MPFPFNVCNHPACHYPGPLQLAFFGTTSQMRWSEMLPALHTANACSVSLGVMQVHAFCRIKTRQSSGIVWCVDDQNMFVWFACMFWRVGALSVSHLVSFRGIMMNEDSMNYHVHHPCYADLPSPPPYPKDVRTEILVVFMESVPIRSKLQSCLGVKNPKTFLVATDLVGSKCGNETGCANFDPQNAQIGVLKKRSPYLSISTKLPLAGSFKRSMVKGHLNGSNHGVSQVTSWSDPMTSRIDFNREDLESRTISRISQRNLQENIASVLFSEYSCWKSSSWPGQWLAGVVQARFLERCRAYK